MASSGDEQRSGLADAAGPAAFFSARGAALKSAPAESNQRTRVRKAFPDDSKLPFCRQFPAV